MTTPQGDDSMSRGMKPFQIMIEGVFVASPVFEGKVGGFHTTFFLKANNASNAVRRVAPMLKERMARHGVLDDRSARLASYYWVHDIWSVTEEAFVEREGRDLGFSFFRIGPLERIHLAMRGAWFRRRKPWLMVECQEDRIA
jgi:hypothetical protein